MRSQRSRPATREARSLSRSVDRAEFHREKLGAARFQATSHAITISRASPSISAVTPKTLSDQVIRLTSQTRADGDGTDEHRHLFIGLLDH